MNFKNRQTNQVPNSPLSINRFNRFVDVNSNLSPNLVPNLNLDSKLNPLNFNNLPSEIILTILNYFDLVELKNLRTLSKYFRDCIDYLLVKELVVYNNFNFTNFNCWSFTCEPLNSKYCLQFNTKKRFFDCSLFTFKLLKKLKINSLVSKCQFKFEDLNGFYQLEHLDLTLTCFKTENECLNLPELKLFSLNTFYPVDLTCITPKLEMFQTNQDLNLIRFEPVCVGLKHLELDKYHEYVVCFQNLVTLKLVRSYPMNPDILRQLPNLEKLHLNCSIDQVSFTNMGNHHNKIKELVNYLHQDKIRLKRTNVRIYIFGVEFTGHIDFTAYDFIYNIQSPLKLHFMYYNQLSDTLPFYDKFEYNDLIITLDQILHINSFPADFFSKFINIQEVTANGIVINQNLFLDFIKHCSNLNIIKIFNCILDPEFYDQLIICCCSTLNQLVIQEIERPIIYYNTVHKELNLNLTKLKLLRYFMTNLNLRKDCVLASIKKLTFLSSISFRFGRGVVNINRNDNSRLNFYYEEDPIFNHNKPFKIKSKNLTFERLSYTFLDLEKRSA